MQIFKLWKESILFFSRNSTSIFLDTKKDIFWVYLIPWLKGFWLLYLLGELLLGILLINVGGDLSFLLLPLLLLFSFVYVLIVFSIALSVSGFLFSGAWRNLLANIWPNRYLLLYNYVFVFLFCGSFYFLLHIPFYFSFASGFLRFLLIIIFFIGILFGLLLLFISPISMFFYLESDSSVNNSCYKSCKMVLLNFPVYLSVFFVFFIFSSLFFNVKWFLVLPFIHYFLIRFIYFYYKRILVDQRGLYLGKD